MRFQKDSSQPVYSTDRIGEDSILRADYSQSNMIPSLEDNPVCMAITIGKLAESSGITKIIFFQKREYEYEYEQTQMLNEIARLYKHFVREKERFSYQALCFGKCRRFSDAWYGEMQNLIFNLRIYQNLMRSAFSLRFPGQEEPKLMY